MKSQLKKINACLLKLMRHHIAFSLVISALFCFFVWGIFGIHYYNIDDVLISFMINGNYTGEFEIIPTFTSVAFTGLLSALYRIFPTIPFYGISFLLVCLLTAHFMVKTSVIYSKRQKSVLPFILCLIVFVQLFIYNFSFLQFTTITGIACGGAIAILMCVGENTGRNEKIIDFIFFYVLLFFGFSIRLSMGYSSFVFVFCCIVCQVFLRKITVKKASVIFFSALIMFFGINYANKLVSSRPEWIEFSKINSVRAYWTDVGKISYDENSKFYEDNGIDNVAYNLLKYGFCYDDNVNYDFFLANRNNLENSNSVNVDDKKKSSFYNEFNYSTIYSIIVSIVVFLVFFKKKEKTKEIIMVFCWGLGLLSLYVYFSYLGRLPERVSNGFKAACWFPMFLILSETVEIKKCSIFKYFVLLFCLLFALVNGGRHLKRTLAEYKADQKDMKLCHEINEFAVNHPDKVFINDPSLWCLVCSPLDAHKNKPFNVIHNIFYGHPIALKQFRKNGFSEIKSKELVDSKVYFVSRNFKGKWKEEDSRNYVEQYVMSRFPDSKKEIVEENPLFTVYHFVR